MRVTHYQVSRQLSVDLVRAPLFCKRQTSSQSLPGILFEFLLEQFHERKAVSCRPGEPTDNVVMDFAQLLGCILEDCRTKGDLPVSNQRDLAAFANTEHCRAVEVVLTMCELIRRSEHSGGSKRGP